MTRGPSRTNGIAVVLTRPSDFSQEAAWDAWYDDTHLPDTVEASGAWVATRWQVHDRPAGYSPAVGFTHVAIYEFDDVASGAPALLDRFEDRRAAGELHPAHAITAVDVFVPTGAWCGRLEPREALRGQVMAYVGPTDPAVVEDWSRWVDEVHTVDMMGSGAFADTSRWVRVDPARFGPNFLTVYDVELDDLTEAVSLSGRAMAPAHEQGRILEAHSGGLRAALIPAGRHGSTGYRHDGAAQRTGSRR